MGIPVLLVTQLGMVEECVHSQQWKGWSSVEIPLSVANQLIMVEDSMHEAMQSSDNTLQAIERQHIFGTSIVLCSSLQVFLFC